jgi:Sec-independent protein secretion pathway component TatC
MLAGWDWFPPRWLANKRKIWFVLAVCCIGTDNTDNGPINQTIIAVPLIILLELSIILARMVYKKREEPATPNLPSISAAQV